MSESWGERTKREMEAQGVWTAAEIEQVMASVSADEALWRTVNAQDPRCECCGRIAERPEIAASVTTAERTRVWCLTCWDNDPARSRTVSERFAMTGREMRLAIADGRCPQCGASGPRSVRLPLVRSETGVRTGTIDRVTCGACGITWTAENNPDFQGVHAEAYG